MTKDQATRKPLRQRVADRKRGIKEVRPMSERQTRLVKYVRIACLTSQYLGLILLLLSLGTMASNGFRIENPNLIVVYSVMFMVGRLGIMIFKSVNMFK